MERDPFSPLEGSKRRALTGSLAVGIGGTAAASPEIRPTMPSGPRSRRLLEPWTFFVDRSLGGRFVADALRGAGEAVEVHDDHFAADAADQTWLADVGGKAWVVLSKDDRIRRNPVECQALLTAGVAAFFLGRSDLRGDQMATTIVAALPAPPVPS